MTTARILNITSAEYHADPCPAPSLSSSVAQILTYQTPLHAYHAHPKLGGGSRDTSRPSEIGTAAHRIALGMGEHLVIIDADSYRTKAAQEARDAAMAAGSTPILGKDYEAAKALAVPLGEAMADYLGAPVADCLRETVVVCEESSGRWRRIMVDIMSPDYLRMLDAKTTTSSVAPRDCQRRLFDGYHIQAAFYLRVGDALDPANIGRRTFGFLFAEQSPPHAVSPPMELSEAGLEIARRDVARACRIWDECVASGKWPGYPRTVTQASPPAWIASEAESRALEEIS